MSRIFWLIFILSSLVLGQSRTYLPIQIVSSNNRAISKATVKLYTTGTLTFKATLIYQKGSAGRYYWTGGTSTVSWGDYDIYVNHTPGVLADTSNAYMTNVSIRNGYTLPEATRDTVAQVLADSLSDYLPRHLQFKDTTTLKLAIFDSAGFTVNLKQLSSTNRYGGGFMELRPASEYAVDAVTVFASGSGSFEWVRAERLKGDVLTPLMAGAIPDDNLSDSLAFAKFTSLLSTGAFEGYIPAGVYDSVICPIKPNQQDEAIVLRGAGIGKTFLNQYGNSTLMDIQHPTANLYIGHVTIQHMTLAGNGSGIGVNSDSVATINTEHLRIQNFGTGYFSDQGNNMRIKSCFFEDNDYGMVLERNNNAFRIVNTYFQDNDSAGVWVQYGKGGTVDNGEYLGNRIHFRIEGEFSTNVVMRGGNCEGADSTIFILGKSSGGQNSRLTFIGTRFIGNNDEDDDNIGWIYGDTQVSFYDLPTPEQYTASHKFAHIVKMSANARVRAYSQKRTDRIVVVDSAVTPVSRTNANEHESIPSNSLISAAASNRGRSYGYYKRETNTSEYDWIHFIRQMKDDTYLQSYLTDGTLYRTGTAKDTQPAYTHDWSVSTQEFNITLAASGDSTLVDSVVVDTMGFTNLHAMSFVMDNANNSAPYFPLTATIRTEDSSAGNGTVDVILWHGGKTVANSKTRRVQFTFYYIARGY